ncbi:unnamed protein product [Blepharisma stoltei]|uniref:Uncharacterized protein n=1 Tax=Blepharisma stoltei TaxID=1481888 RepID=A0AAU9KHI8_9CILI|nr:unnamed protein product [Blepharisma stoltei]
MGSCISFKTKILADKQTAELNINYQQKRIAIRQIYQKKAKQAPILKLDTNPLYIKRTFSEITSKTGVSNSLNHLLD